MHACMQIGNAALDDETDMNGMIDYAWHHALISPVPRTENQMQFEAIGGVLLCHQ